MWLQTRVLDGRRVIALDGMSSRGTRDGARNLTHLLSEDQRIPVLTKLLDTREITGAVITADALHTQRSTADYIVSRGRIKNDRHLM